MISNDMVEVSVTYGSKITFFLRMISIAEEEQLRQKTFGLKEEEKAEKEYANNVQLLKDLSVKKPIGLYPDRPTVSDAMDNTIYIDDLTTVDAIDAFFTDKTAVKERISFFAVRGFFVRLQPAESFF